MRHFIFSTILLTSGCVTLPSTSEDQPDVVIQRIDDLDERPDWLQESEPFRVLEGSVTALGATEIPGDHRIDAAFRIAENNGKSLIASSIEQRLEFILQNAEEGTSFDATQARFIGAEAAKLATSSIRPGRRYWEKFATTLDDGRRVTRFRVFATVMIPEKDFKRAVFDAIKKAQGQSGISADFAKKVDAQWELFIKGSPSTPKLAH